MNIKLTSNKELLVTSHSPIFQGENAADKISFIIPLDMGITSAAKVAMTYITPGNVKVEEELVFEEDTEKNVLRSEYEIKEEMTAVAGKIRLQLFIEEEDKKIYSEETIITVLPIDISMKKED